MYLCMHACVLIKLNMYYIYMFACVCVYIYMYLFECTYIIYNVHVFDMYVYINRFKYAFEETNK